MSDRSDLLRGRYALGTLLGGRDGSATYLARDVQTGKPCVIKTLAVGAVVRSKETHSFDPDDFTKLIELFEREARVLAHLEHSGIPQFIDHFTETVDGDTRLYTVQEYVEGKTLQALVAEGKHFTEDEARDICAQIAEILQHLHGRSPPLIHRDIKPRNVILDPAGGVHLVDFGSVRNAIGGDVLDGKTIVGTYGYMPIEQYEARAVPQSDFYALGMTLVFILSHKEPTEIPRRGVWLDFRPHVNVSEHFASVIERMIEPAPEDRHESAEELVMHLASPLMPAIRIGVHAWRKAFAALVVFATLVGGSVTWGLLSAPNSSFSQDAIVRVSPPRAAAGGSRPRPPVQPTEGVLRIDLDRDFRYVATGWPMGRSVSQTALPGLAREPREDLRLPADLGGPGSDIYFGYFAMGNGADRTFSFALVGDAGSWALHVDSNNNEDLSDDGVPHFNEGTGMILATQTSLDVEVVGPSGEPAIRPYHLWVWFDEDDAEQPSRGRFYSRNHFAGVLALGGNEFAASAFEMVGHDGLFRDDGICIDLSGDGDCQEGSELFFDGDVVEFPGGSVELILDYS